MGLGKPIVWCLSDMGPITGGCHYSMGCDGFQSGCMSCPALSLHDDRPQKTLQRRSDLWEGITFVTPSRWLEGCVKNSVIGKRNDVRYIRTGVELDVFKPYHREACRKEFGLDNNRTTIFCGSSSTKEYRKGFSHLPALVEAMKKRGLGDFQLVVVGSQSNELKALNCDVKSLGSIKDREKLARIYSAADIALLPYLEDNLPNVALEAISCGIPVAAYSIGGLPDVVIPGVNGDLATHSDTDELAEKLVSCVKAKHSRYKIRSWAVDNIDINIQGNEYMELFDELLSRSAHPINRSVSSRGGQFVR